MTDEELAEIERVWGAATPGPWFAHSENGQKVGGQYVEQLMVVDADGNELGRNWFREVDTGAGYVWEPDEKACEQADKDREAISKAPGHIKALVAEVKRWRQAFAAARADRDRARP